MKKVVETNKIIERVIFLRWYRGYVAALRHQAERENDWDRVGSLNKRTDKLCEQCYSLEQLLFNENVLNEDEWTTFYNDGDTSWAEGYKFGEREIKCQYLESEG